MYSAFLFGSESSSDEMAWYDEPPQQSQTLLSTSSATAISSQPLHQSPSFPSNHLSGVQSGTGFKRPLSLNHQEIATPRGQEVTTPHCQDLTTPQGPGITTIQHPEISTSDYPVINTSHYSSLRTSQYLEIATPHHQETPTSQNPEIPNPHHQATTMTDRQLEPSSTFSSAAIVSIPPLHQTQYFPSYDSRQSGGRGGSSYEQRVSLNGQEVATPQGQGLATPQYPQIPISQLEPTRRIRRRHNWTAFDKEIYTILYIGTSVTRQSTKFGANFVRVVPNAPYQDDLNHLAKVLAEMVRYLKNTPLAQAMTNKRTLSRYQTKKVRNILSRVSMFDLSSIGMFYVNGGSTPTSIANRAAQAKPAQASIAQPSGQRPVFTAPRRSDAHGSLHAQDSNVRDAIDLQDAIPWGFGGAGSRYPLDNPSPTHNPPFYRLPPRAALPPIDQHPSQTPVVHGSPSNQRADLPAPHHPRFTAQPVAEKSADANADIDPALINPALLNPPAGRLECLEAVWRGLL